MYNFYLQAKENSPHSSDFIYHSLTTAQTEISNGNRNNKKGEIPKNLTPFKRMKKTTLCQSVDVFCNT